VPSRPDLSSFKCPSAFMSGFYNVECGGRHREWIRRPECGYAAWATSNAPMAAVLRDVARLFSPIGSTILEL